MSLGGRTHPVSLLYSRNIYWSVGIEQDLIGDVIPPQSVRPAEAMVSLLKLLLLPLRLKLSTGI